MITLKGDPVCDDVRSVSRERFGEHLDVISAPTLRLVIEHLETLLGF